MGGAHRLRRLLRIAVLPLLSSFWLPAQAAPDACASSIRLAVDHWLAVQKPSGFLSYGYDFLGDREAEADTLSASNLTRQAYAAAVLADYYESTRDERARPALRKLLAAIAGHSLPVGKGRLQSLLEGAGLLSLPVGRTKLQSLLGRLGLLYESAGPGRLLAPDSDYGQAYSGTVALALVAELRYARASGDQSFAPLRAAWLEGLLVLRIPGDGFRISPAVIDSNPYFDGESWLALGEYHRSFPGDQRLAAVLADLDRALLDKYGGEFVFDFYHWGAMAAARRYQDTRDGRFLAFVAAQARGFLDRGRRRLGGENDCALVEGSADALAALDQGGTGDSGPAAGLREWVAVEMAKVRQLQIQPGQEVLAFANARVVAPRMRAFAGSFRSGLHAADVQVDYAAHCVSAMLKLQRRQACPA